MGTASFLSIHKAVLHTLSLAKLAIPAYYHLQVIEHCLILDVSSRQHILTASSPAGMGNTPSSVLDNIVEGSNFDREEVDRLRKRFEKLDRDNSGTIERDEFLSLPQVSSNPLATRMIAIFDEDGGGDVDFQEFVSGLAAFSSKGSKEEKLKFAFKVYDIDRDGYISNGELFIVLKMMVGSNLKDGQLQQIVDKTIMEADGDKDGTISFEEFTKMVENTDVSMSLTLDQF